MGAVNRCSDGNARLLKDGEGKKYDHMPVNPFTKRWKLKDFVIFVTGVRHLQSGCTAE